MNFRMPRELRDALKKRAAENRRSLTSELIVTLERSFEMATGSISLKSAPVAEYNTAALASGASITKV